MIKRILICNTKTTYAVQFNMMANGLVFQLTICVGLFNFYYIDLVTNNGACAG